MTELAAIALTIAAACQSAVPGKATECRAEVKRCVASQTGETQEAAVERCLEQRG